MNKANRTPIRRAVVRMDIIDSRCLRRDSAGKLRIFVDRLHFFLVKRDARVHSLKDQRLIPRCLLYSITDGDNSKALITYGDSVTEYIKDVSCFTKKTVAKIYSKSSGWVGDHKRITHHSGIGIGSVDAIEDDMSRNVGIAYELSASAQSIYHDFYHKQGYIFNQITVTTRLKDMILYSPYGRACYKTQIRAFSRILNFADKVLWFIDDILDVNYPAFTSNNRLKTALEEIGFIIDEGINELINAICLSFNQNRYKLCIMGGKKCLNAVACFLELLFQEQMLCDDERAELLGIVSSLLSSLESLKKEDNKYISLDAA